MAQLVWFGISTNKLIDIEIWTSYFVFKTKFRANRFIIKRKRASTILETLIFKSIWLPSQILILDPIKISNLIWFNLAKVGWLNKTPSKKKLLFPPTKCRRHFAHQASQNIKSETTSTQRKKESASKSWVHQSKGWTDIGEGTFYNSLRDPFSTFGSVRKQKETISLKNVRDWESSDRMCRASKGSLTFVGLISWDLAFGDTLRKKIFIGTWWCQEPSLTQD